MGDVPHKSPGNNALVSADSDTKKKQTFQMSLHLPCSLNLTFGNILCDDSSMDFFVKSFVREQDKSNLSIYQWKFVLRIVLM